MSHRRPSTVILGLVLILGTTAYALVNLWATRSLSDRTAGALICGVLLFVTFRAGVWPAVFVDDEGVIVRNPLVDHIFTGAVEIEVREGEGPHLSQGGVSVPALAFSRSLIDQVTGERALRRLQADISGRVWETTGESSYRKDRLRVLKQFGFFVAISLGAALVGELPFWERLFR